ncbi:hypothetical protein GDO81_027200 [Engystomops pustulosus]|uniref:Taste receptor type 2 n=1 Tax=Engystomops pustulosus TaxID=76066 RepID=A0AAV6YK74_ENGPU|nr:hypothetical protein GDO81_027200 [Engystomops pustulosus]
MIATLKVFQIIVITFSCIVEIILSSSVIIIYIIEWKKNQQLGVTDKIFIFMAINNLLLQCCTNMNCLIYLFWFYQMITKQYFLFFALNLCFIYDNVWHTAWLSLHYCLKLVNPSHWVFVRMKKWMSSSIVSMLIATSIVMFLINLPYGWTARLEILLNKTTTRSYNYDIIFDRGIMVYNIIIGCCIPFLVAFICIGLSVWSLVNHIWRMRRHSAQSRSSPQLQGHVRAIVTMIIQMLLNLLLYLSVIGLFMTSSNSDEIFVVILWSSIMICPCAQTLTIILRNPKLKNQMTQSISQCSQRLFSNIHQSS